MSNNNGSGLYRCGTIHLILGPMYSGKTSELIKRYDRYTIGGKKCIMVKYKNDTRYDTSSVVTHNGTKVDSHVAENLYELDEIVANYDVVCVDEIQFYEDAHIFCDKWANEGKIVICCGLSGNFKREPFPIINKLIPLVENITSLTAICEGTGEDAPYTHRFTEDQADEVIGGKEMYSAMDRQSYLYHNPGTSELKFLEFINFYCTKHHIKIENDLKVKFIQHFRKYKQQNNFPKILKDCFVMLDPDARMLTGLTPIINKKN
jgi:thymidine kinase